MENETLLKLESVVQKMLANIDDLKQENGALRSQVHEKKAKIEELEAKVAAMNSDQDAVSSRVSTLISSIEEWEKSIEQATNDIVDDYEDGFTAAGDEQEGKPVTGKLFDMGE